MEWAEAKTAANDRITLFVAFNYGGRAEIVDAAARFTGGGEEDSAKLLYAPEMHDPELVIRTSGEQRLSNYLLWQSAYSELHFTDVLWPDFSRADLEAALEAYARAPPALRRALMARARPARSRRAQPRLGPRTCPRGSSSRCRRSRSRSSSSPPAAGSSPRAPSRWACCACTSCSACTRACGRSSSRASRR